LLNPGESKAAINHTGSNGSLGVTDLEASKPLMRGEDGEFEATRGKDNRQILDTQKKMLKDQD
jgi:hypothetical protein